MNPMPADAADRERRRRRSSRRAPPGRRTPRGRAGPTFRASGARRSARARASLEADADDAVDDPDRRRHGPRCADAPLGLARDLRPSPAGNPCETSVVSSATTGRRAASASATSGATRRRRPHGIAPICRDATGGGVERQLGPADEEPAGERVARAGRVDDRRRPARQLALPSAVRTRHPPAPRFTTTVAASSAPTSSASASLANTASGPSRREALPERPDADLPTAAVDERSTLIRTPRRPRRRARSPAAASARGCTRGRGATRSPRARRGRARSGAKAGATPRSLSIVRAPSGVAIETTVPVPVSTSGPATSTPRRRARPRRARPAGSRRACRRTRARPPSATTQAATFAAWPPAPTRVRP